MPTAYIVIAVVAVTGYCAVRIGIRLHERRLHRKEIEQMLRRVNGDAE